MSFIDFKHRLQMWGGVECTVNRVNDSFRDQLLTGGHEFREDDIQRIADLGLDAVRYPVLWERAVQSNSSVYAWDWCDDRLQRLQTLKVPVILGLVHHGSGPHHTDLLQDSFIDGLRDYAKAVAERYPWAIAYTPINEPLTTARFSALYGHWYPHSCSDEAFSLALINQCLATIEAMKAIHKVNGAAKFLLTEDLSKVHSTQALAHQAHFENSRRWLGIDLLLGRVDRTHPMWDYLARSSKLKNKLSMLQDSPCVPDVLGFNYYITSERFIDERTERYPQWTHGGNGDVVYADVEAVRVRSENVDGLETLLNEAWQRYKLPLSVTEIHLGGFREDQMRWLLNNWEACLRVRDAGIDLRAMTVWSLFGSVDWNSLCTRQEGMYESGVYDVRGTHPRPTALANVIKSLTGISSKSFRDSVPRFGWWQTSDRLSYPAVHTTAAQDHAKRKLENMGSSQKPLVIFGTASSLTRAFIDCCKSRHLPFQVFDEEDILGRPAFIRSLIRDIEPWTIINATYRGDHAPSDEEDSVADLELVTIASKLCNDLNIHLLNFTSRFVFDCHESKIFVESDDVGPNNTVGRRDVAIEKLISRICRQALIVRTGILVHHPIDSDEAIELEFARKEASNENFESTCFTYLPDLANACLDLLFDCEIGIWHLVSEPSSENAQTFSMRDKKAQTSHKFGQSSIHETLSDETRSIFLASERGHLLPPRTDLLRHYWLQNQSEESKCPAIKGI